MVQPHLRLNGRFFEGVELRPNLIQHYLRIFPQLSFAITIVVNHVEIIQPATPQAGFQDSNLLYGSHTQSFVADTRHVMEILVVGLDVLVILFKNRKLTVSRKLDNAIVGLLLRSGESHLQRIEAFFQTSDHAHSEVLAITTWGNVSG